MARQCDCCGADLPESPQGWKAYRIAGDLAFCRDCTQSGKAQLVEIALQDEREQDA